MIVSSLAKGFHLEVPNYVMLLSFHSVTSTGSRQLFWKHLCKSCCRVFIFAMIHAATRSTQTTIIFSLKSTPQQKDILLVEWVLGNHGVPWCVENGSISLTLLDKAQRHQPLVHILEIWPTEVHHVNFYGVRPKIVRQRLQEGRQEWSAATPVARRHCTSSSKGFLCLDFNIGFQQL